VSGSGDDIWNNADAFNFAYEPLVGDGVITARVTSITNTDYWAKGAVMFRNSLDANSAFVDLVMTPVGHDEDSLQWRDTQGGGPGSIDQGPGSAPLPYWIRLTRHGNTFTGEKSTDGVNWVLVGTHTTNSMNQQIFVGFAVTAHNNSGVLNTSTFDNASIVQLCADMGPVPPPGGGAPVSAAPARAALVPPLSGSNDVALLVGALNPLAGLSRNTNGFLASQVPVSLPLTDIAPALGNLDLVKPDTGNGDGTGDHLVSVDPLANLKALDQVFAKDPFEVT